jgi:predicted metal-dependent hydrolase
MLFNHLSFAYTIRRSQRATRARIVVKPGQVEIVAPPGIAELKLHRFVQAKHNWVAQALRRMEKATPQSGGFVPDTFATGTSMSYQGKTYPVMLKPTKLKRIKIEFDCAYIFHLPEIMEQENRNEMIKEALIRWLRKQIKPIVEHYVNIHAGKNQLYPRSITIKAQKSRWGSCGIKNDININWLLLMAPAEVLEYVVVHELCHIKVKNHSSQFWALVAEHLPDYQSRRLWLKREGRGLMLAF